MSGIFTKMRSLPTHYPLIRGMISYAIIWPTCSIVQEYLDHGATIEEANFARAARFGIFGSLFMAPVFYGWMKFSGRFFRSNTLKTAVLRAAIEQVSYSPLAMAYFFFGMSLLEFKPLHVCWNEVKEKFWPTYKIGVIFWPTAQTFNFYCVSEKNRIVFVSIASLIWTIYLAHMKAKEPKNLMLDQDVNALKMPKTITNYKMVVESDTKDQPLEGASADPNDSNKSKLEKKPATTLGVAPKDQVITDSDGNKSNIPNPTILKSGQDLPMATVPLVTPSIPDKIIPGNKSNIPNSTILKSGQGLPMATVPPVTPSIPDKIIPGNKSNIPNSTILKSGQGLPMATVPPVTPSIPDKILPGNNSNIPNSTILKSGQGLPMATVPLVTPSIPDKILPGNKSNIPNSTILKSGQGLPMATVPLVTPSIPDKILPATATVGTDKAKGPVQSGTHADNIPRNTIIIEPTEPIVTEIVSLDTPVPFESKSENSHKIMEEHTLTVENINNSDEIATDLYEQSIDTGLSQQNVDLSIIQDIRIDTNLIDITRKVDAAFSVTRPGPGDEDKSNEFPAEDGKNTDPAVDESFPKDVTTVLNDNSLVKVPITDEDRLKIFID